MAPFSIHQGDPADLDEMADIWAQAMAPDPFWKVFMGSMTDEQIVRHVKAMIYPIVVAGGEIGAMETWKMMDEANGKIAAWTGLSVPKTLTKAEAKSLAIKWELPPEANLKTRDFLVQQVATMTTKHGYDGRKHFHRRGSMCRPEYQRQGLMRRLTAHINAIADAYGALIYTNARPSSAGMFVKEGFGVNGWIDLELGEMDERFKGLGELNNGQTRFRSLKREIGANPTPNMKLVDLEQQDGA